MFKWLIKLRETFYFCYWLVRNDAKGRSSRSVIPELRRERQEDWEFKGSFIIIMSSRPAWAIYHDSVSSSLGNREGMRVWGLSMRIKKMLQLPGEPQKRQGVGKGQFQTRLFGGFHVD